MEFSIVIPAFNEEKFLLPCLQSLKEQKFSGNFEILVVDNGSTDNTAQVAKIFGARVVRESRRGVCLARQRGATEAKGKIIISTDADCVFPPNWLEQYEKAFLDSKTIAAFGPFKFTPLPRWGKIYSRVAFSLVHYVYKKTGKVMYVAAANFAFLKSSLQAAGGYNTRLTQGGDEYDLLKRIQKLGHIQYLHENKVLTSSRRLKKGFLYSLFVTLFYYYFLDYLLANFVTGKSVFGHYPAFRDHVEKPSMGRRILTASLYAGVAIVAFSMLPRNWEEIRDLQIKAAQAKTVALNSGQKIGLALRHRTHFGKFHFNRVEAK